MKSLFLYKIAPRKDRGIIWVIVGWLLIEVLAFSVFSKIATDANVIAGSITAITVVFGYFITHYLEIARKREEKKFHQYCELVKALRLFINESGLTPHEKKELVNKYQDAYFGAALFISKDAFDILRNTSNLCHAYLNSSGDKTLLETFKTTQSKLINCLRAELTGGKDIQFETYDIR